VAVSQCLSQPRKIIAGDAFEPFGQPTVEGSPRLFRNVAEGSVPDDIVGETNANDVHRGDATGGELACRVLEPADGPALEERGIADG
jgi:hypothetical protein